MYLVALRRVCTPRRRLRPRADPARPGACGACRDDRSRPTRPRRWPVAAPRRAAPAETRNSSIGRALYFQSPPPPRAVPCRSVRNGHVRSRLQSSRSSRASVAATTHITWPQLVARPMPPTAGSRATWYNAAAASMPRAAASARTRAAPALKTGRRGLCQSRRQNAATAPCGWI